MASSGLKHCQTVAHELNAQFQASSNCSREVGTPSFACSGVLLTVRSTLAPLLGEETRCPTTKELVAAATNGDDERTANVALWCPHRIARPLNPEAIRHMQRHPLWRHKAVPTHAIVDDARNGHVSVSYIRSDLPHRILWNGLDGVGYVYDSAMIAAARAGNRSLVLRLFPNDGGTVDKPGCGGLTHISSADALSFPQRGCFTAPNHTVDDTVYARLSDIPAARPASYESLVRAHRCRDLDDFLQRDHGHNRTSKACVITADQFDEVFLPATSHSSPDWCIHHNEVVVQTTPGLPHAEQPIHAFFYKSNDVPRCAADIREHKPHANRTDVELMLQQACLFNRLLARGANDDGKVNARGDARRAKRGVAAVGLDLSHEARVVRKAPFFCDASLDYSCRSEL